MTTYYVNDEVAVTCTFTTAAGTATDPTTVTFKAQNPADTVTSYVYGTAAEVTKTGTGVFKLTVTLGSAGPWQVLAAGTGTVARSAVTSLVVKQRPGD